MSRHLPPLRHISISHLTSAALPVSRIRTENDIETWKTTRGYQDYALFLQKLNEAVVGVYLPWVNPEPCLAVIKTLDMLDTLDKWIDDIPPLPTPQRFGNLAFRAWGKRLEDEIDGLLQALLPADLHLSIPYLAPYLLTSFGSFTRMDYGTGHETSFGLFLLCLTLIRFFPFVTPTTSSPKIGQSVPPQDLSRPSQINIERDLVLTIFLRYLRLCWRLQDVYRLEPAGSHGVWGLDDSSFLGYIWGSGQLRDQSKIPPTAVLDSPPLPATNLYFLSISRIHEVKRGPFHEHSSQLHSIAVGVPNWGKVNKGLFLMYDFNSIIGARILIFVNLRRVQAEVLGKRVVVQHTPLGGLIEWGTDPIPPTHNVETQKTPSLSSVQVGDIKAPWTASSPSTSIGPPTISANPGGTRAPWAVGGISKTLPLTSASQDGRVGEVDSQK